MTSGNPLATPTRSFSSFLLGLDNLAELPREEALDALRTYLATLRTVREMISDTAENHPRSNFFIDAFFDYLLTLQDA
ncbi:MAG: hypothetical protein GTO14_00245, partial [Anaerolineales bacterium]|nr:hypothetical protein [Anaerolineales bacterium]